MDDHNKITTQPSSWPTMPAAVQAQFPNNIPIELTPITGHVNMAERTVQKHVCETCTPPKIFARAEHLRRHQLSHAAPQYKCPECDKVFHKPDLLSTHMLKNEDKHRERKLNKRRQLIRDIIVEQKPIEETVDDIMELFYELQLTQNSFEDEPSKNLILDKFLTEMPENCDAGTTQDSGFVESVYENLGYQAMAPHISPNSLLGEGPHNVEQGPSHQLRSSDFTFSPNVHAASGSERSLTPGLDTVTGIGTQPTAMMELDDPLEHFSQHIDPQLYDNNILQPQFSQETSEDATSKAFSSTEIHHLSASVIGEQAGLMTKHVIGFFQRIIELQLRIPCRQRVDPNFVPEQTEEATAAGSNSLLKATTNNTDSKKRARRRAGGRNSSQGDTDEEDEEQGVGTKRLKVEGNTKQKVSCPFTKRYPVEFSTWRTCVGPGFDGLSRMKEHLKRRHFKEHVCARCGTQFQSSRLLQEHSRALDPCPLREAQQDLGFITQLQWDDIQTRTRGHKNLHERWRDIYIVLFPEVDEMSIPGPYFDIPETKQALTGMIDPEEYGAYLKQHLPRRVLVKLNQEFQIMAEHAKQRLVEIAQEESTETLKGYMLSKGIGALRPDQCEEQGETFAQENMHWSESLLESIDMFSQQAPSYGMPDDVFNFTWPSVKGKEPEDSAYGSYKADGNSTAGACI